MSSNRTTIDGETYSWLPTDPGRTTARADFTVYWLEGGDFERRVELGRLKQWRLGAGWEVLPRLGGRDRAREGRMGLARTRLGGVKYLLTLAQTEQQLSVLDKVRLRIVRDGDGDHLIDDSRGLPAVPAPLSAAA